MVRSASGSRSLALPRSRRRAAFAIALFGLAALAGPTCVLGAQALPAGFTYETLVDGPLASATAMAFAPDGRLFLTERETGNIRVFENGQLRAAPWATVAVTNHGSWSEAGLLGIAVDPDFLNNHYLYVFHTINNENVIARLQEVAGQGANYTVLTPPGAISAIPYHNSGPLVFGWDGTLYAQTGDSFSTTAPQDLQSWNGKVLRFEVPNLTVPANNPFPGNPVYSLGHRNGFGLSIHPVTGELFQTENGGALMDEVNRIVPGGNYGWPQVEGQEITPDPSLVDPLAWYQPTTALTGGAFYDGQNYPAQYQYNWFFTDYNFNHLRAMTLDSTGQNVLGDTLFHDQPGAGYGVAMGPDGNLWYLTNDGGGYGADEIGRYVHSNEPMPSVHMMSTSQRAIGGSVTIGVHAHNGDLAIAWLSWSRFSSPVPTPIGNQWVPIDAVLPPLLVTADDRAYLGISVPNNPSVSNQAMFVQAAAFTPATGLVAPTNPGKTILH
ncbi:MAG: PQQ-dependent sugar dehydrogenase [Planctomycetes bacterium]|nr:PQQ-dependent sugar dehydrogenase [Planctomycetota bacterium]